MTIKQKPQGNPLPNQKATGADTIALLARVNLGSVAKVLTAIHVIAEHCGIDPAEVVRLMDVPSKPPLFDGSARDDVRVGSTEQLCAEIAVNPKFKDVYEFLYLNRFKGLRAGSKAG